MLMLSNASGKDDLSKNLKLMQAILLDKISCLARDRNDFSDSATRYFQAISRYQDIIDPEKEDEFSVLSFALTFNLCNENQHVTSALTAIDQFNRILDEKPNLQGKFASILEKLKTQAKEQKSSSPQNLHAIFNTFQEFSKSQSNKTGGMNDALLHTLILKVTALEKIANARDTIKLDLKVFENDANQNRAEFYRLMRVKLSHTFAAMAVTSGVGGDPIIKHDRTGTQFL